MDKEVKPYKIGVALSGGGARGFAHAGALQALEEAGLKPDILAGVSAGSVVAVLYASGYKPEKMLELFANRKFNDFAKISIGNGAIFSAERFKGFMMKAIAPRTQFEDLDIKTVICATDFDNGVSKVFDAGPLADPLLASCSIPIVFSPVVINGVRYVDGGVLRNMPSWTIRDKCQTLIGINVSPVKPTAQGNGILDIALHTYNLMAKSNQKRDMKICDIAIETPEISMYQVFNLKEIEKVYRSGYLNTRRTLKKMGLWKPANGKPSNINQSSAK
jgi:NTE family protein